jgi:hypothetical protein
MGGILNCPGCLIRAGKEGVAGLLPRPSSACSEFGLPYGLLVAEQAASKGPYNDMVNAGTINPERSIFESNSKYTQTRLLVALPWFRYVQ